MTNFRFTDDNLVKAEKFFTKYPKERKKSAILSLLDLAQRQNDNYLSNEAIEYVAKLLEIAPIRVYEVASFYTMFNQQKLGENLIQICRTTSCWLRGSDKITEICEKKIGIKLGETSKDNKFTLREVECLGACINAPVIQINDDYYEDLNEEITSIIINNLQNGNKEEAQKYIDKNIINKGQKSNA